MRARLPTFRHARRADRGQALIETSIVLVSFLALLLTLFDMGRVFAGYQSLQNAVREAARLGTTGRLYAGLDRTGSIAYQLASQSQLGVALGDVTIENLHEGVRGSGPGGSFDTLIVSAGQTVPVYSPWLAVVFGHHVRVRARSAAKNEDLDTVTYPTLTTTTTTTTTYLATTSTTTMPTSSTASTSTTIASTTTESSTTTTTTTTSTSTAANSTSTTDPPTSTTATSTTSTTATTSSSTSPSSSTTASTGSSTSATGTTMPPSTTTAPTTSSTTTTGTTATTYPSTTTTLVYG